MFRHGSPFSSTSTFSKHINIFSLLVSILYKRAHRPNDLFGAENWFCRIAFILDGITHTYFFGFLGLISAYCLSLCHKTTSALLGLSLYIVGTLAILAVGAMSARSANGHGPGSTWRFSWDYQMFHMSPYRCNERMYSGVDSSLSISARVLVFSEAPYSVIDSYFT